MKIHRSTDTFEARKPVLTIGTFDGLHQGHLSIIEKLKNTAKALGGESVVMTFWPHPRMVLQADAAKLELLNTLDERIELLAQTGIDHLIVYPFTREFAALSSCEFIEQVLVAQLHIAHLIVGFNHAFGRNREGNFDSLTRCAGAYGFGIEKVSALAVEEVNISSTKIRQALADGNIELAQEYLGRPFCISGKVVLGNQLGRRLGFPTANIDAERYKLVPQDGVYAVRIRLSSGEFYGMLNIGHRPTIRDPRKQKTIEVHILDFSDDIYEQELVICFVKRIRGEQFFESIEDLSAQLAKDKAVVRAIFGLTE